MLAFSVGTSSVKDVKEHHAESHHVHGCDVHPTSRDVQSARIERIMVRLPAGLHCRGVSTVVALVFRLHEEYSVVPIGAPQVPRDLDTALPDMPQKVQFDLCLLSNE
jgi:hypothetical protein